jgi:hypothetical protein
MKLIAALSTTLVSAFFSLSTTMPAHAGTVDRVESLSPVLSCQPALPAYEGKVRKRPLAMVNEGTSTAYVTCGLTSDENSPYSEWPGPRMVMIEVANYAGTSSATVNCTLVEPLGYYYPLAIEVTAGTSSQSYWLAYSLTEGQGFGQRWTFYRPAISCALPPQTQINTIYEFHLASTPE